MVVPDMLDFGLKTSSSSTLRRASSTTKKPARQHESEYQLQSLAEAPQRVAPVEAMEVPFKSPFDNKTSSFRYQFDSRPDSRAGSLQGSRQSSRRSTLRLRKTPLPSLNPQKSVPVLPKVKIEPIILKKTQDQLAASLSRLGFYSGF